MKKRMLRLLSASFSAALLATVAVSQPLPAHASAPSAPTGWTNVFTDDFNGASGSGLNTANWLYDTGHSYPGGAWNWGRGEIESYTSSTSNVYQDGAGHLVIKATRDGSGNWTSGRVETQSTNFQPPAGGVMHVEASLQLPNVTGSAAQGYWPAFWMLGAPFRGNYQNWPSVGEIDIMENVNGVNTEYGTLHCGSSPGGPCNETSGIGGNKTGFSPSLQTAFHKYAVEVDKSVSPQQIRWYVDGVNFFTVNSNQVDATTWSNATDHGWFLLLNLAMGGDWPGSPTASTVSGAAMLVDYVTVWTKPGNGGGGTTTDTSYGVNNVSSSQANFYFQPNGYSAQYVILHYTIPGQAQQNVNMTYNSGTGRWEYTAGGLSSGQNVSYSYTYNKNGLQYDTAWYSYTKP
ncbi:glycoside hydrolase family 16 protein [Tumebacillus flagellatus]|uniref:Uncharacterized protein n=1 Tax=Tumebacillus flagellatus TaxID=1157490 RepID=A0A074MCE0_9BACL|nr:glycoside hydrolase family 16 protein [Tumebacillus flagellatus]KEO83552.1 hypothetical protein EL26_09050 [Tumebacillus flagellatus]